MDLATSDSAVSVADYVNHSHDDGTPMHLLLI